MRHAHTYSILLLSMTLIACTPEKPPEKKHSKPASKEAPTPAPKIVAIEYNYKNYLHDINTLLLNVRSRNFAQAHKITNNILEKLPHLVPLGSTNNYTRITFLHQGTLSELFFPVPLDETDFSDVSKALKHLEENNLKVSDISIVSMEQKLTREKANDALQLILKELKQEPKDEANPAKIENHLRNAPAFSTAPNDPTIRYKRLANTYLNLAKILFEHRLYGETEDVLENAQQALNEFHTRHAPESSEDKEAKNLERRIQNLQKQVEKVAPSLIDNLMDKMGVEA